MTNGEIRKLLGGYATNTLTDAERKALFEAALEDQELFDALHGEQALKDLLDDPISRDQIRQALEKTGPARVQPAWWSRWWAWTGAASAVAAAVLIVAVTRPHGPQPAQHYASVQTPQAAAAPPVEKLGRDEKAVAVPPPGVGRMAHYAAGSAVRGSAGKQAVRARALGAQNERKDELALDATRPAPPPRAAPAPQQAPAAIAEQVQVTAQAPPPAPRSQSRATSNQAQSQEAPQMQNQAVNSLREQEQNQIAPSAVSGAVFKSLPPVTYSILKRDQSGAYQPLTQETELKPGEAVRLTVAPTMSGYLSLLRRNASGTWEQVFPETGPGLPVSANANYTIPDVPIEVQDTEQNFRLALVPVSTNVAAFSTELRQRSQLGGAKAKTAPSKKESAAASTPLVVDLTIGLKKSP